MHADAGYTWPGKMYAVLTGKEIAVTTPKEKILLALETDRASAEKDMRRWSAAYRRYEADIILNADADLPVNLRTVSSRNLAKDELDNAREAKRLYGIAIAAVRKA